MSELDSNLRLENSGQRDQGGDGLTAKQEAFCAHLTNPNGPAFGNKTAAARAAGYKGGADQLAVQGHRNSRNPKIRRRLWDALEAQGVTTELRARTVREGLLATKQRCFASKDGGVIYAEAESDWAERRRMLEFVQGLEDKAVAQSSSASAPAPVCDEDFSALSQFTDQEAADIAHVAQFPPAERNAAREAIAAMIEMFDLVQKRAQTASQGETAAGPSGASDMSNNARAED